MKQLFGIDRAEPFKNLLGVLQDYNFVKVNTANPGNKYVRSELRKNDLKLHLQNVDAFKNVLEDEE